MQAFGARMLSLPYALAAAALALGAIAAWLARPLRADPADRAELARAVDALDRELAGNLELMSMFDQTKQAVVLENSQYGTHHAVVERVAPNVAPSLADLYGRIPDTESAMERRGPANSIREADRQAIEAWEGDARAAQGALRSALHVADRRGWSAAIARLRGRLAAR